MLAACRLFAIFAPSNIRLRTMFTENEYFFFKTPYKVPKFEVLIMHGRHGSRV